MHFLMKTLRNVATEMAPHVLAYNLTRVMNIVGIKPLLLRSGRGEACALGRAKRPDEHALLVGIMLLIAHVLSCRPFLSRVWRSDALIAPD